MTRNRSASWAMPLSCSVVVFVADQQIWISVSNVAKAAPMSASTPVLGARRDVHCHGGHGIAPAARAIAQR
jgi:hypothetical protein